MPNFDLIKYNNIHQKNPRLEPCLNYCKNTSLKSSVKNMYHAIQYQSNTIDLWINQNGKRLEVINFILSTIDLLVINTGSNYPQSARGTESSFNQIKYHKDKISSFTKAKFLRDSEVILLCICQAILIADKSIINNAIRHELIFKSINLKFQIEKTYLIDIIKTLVVDFLKSITFDSSKNIDCFTAEISDYFDTVVSLMLNFGLKTGTL